MCVVQDVQTALCSVQDPGNTAVAYVLPGADYEFNMFNIATGILLRRAAVDLA